MKHRIDPTVDCVFKAILGGKNNTVSLVHFLNSVLKPEPNAQIKEAIILNPYNEREFIDDKLSIVDVKAQDEMGNQYQIEIQLTAIPALRQRILYTWSSLYHSLIQSGDEYHKLRKTVSIWLIADTLFPGVKEHHLPFCLYNEQHKLLLTDHMQVHLIQMPEWQWGEMPQEELDRWMYLFTQGEEIDLDNPPEILRVKEMEPVMETMKRFSEKELEYDLYERRRLAVMDAKAMKAYKEEMQAQKEEMQAQKKEMQTQKEALEVQLKAQQAETEKERQEKEKERAEKEREKKEKERLLYLLKQSGIDPGQGN